MTEQSEGSDAGHEHGSHSHDGHSHGGHSHGHARDQSLRGFLRYMRKSPRMWSSVANRYVVESIDPQPGEVCLDIGAGMGPAAVGAAQQGATVYAADPTSYMRTIMNFRRRLARPSGQLTIIDAAAEHLPLDDAMIDAAWAVNSMHHWHDLDAAARELVRVLKPGGRVLLVDEDFQHPNHELNKENAGPQKRNGMEPVGAAEMAEALTRAGMVEVDSVDLEVTPTIPIKQASGRRR